MSAIDLADVRKRADERDAEKEAQERAERVTKAVAWVRAMNRAFKGISGAPSRAGYATLARKRFDV